jgi:hypothetical protein
LLLLLTLLLLLLLCLLLLWLLLLLLLLQAVQHAKHHRVAPVGASRLQDSRVVGNSGSARAGLTNLQTTVCSS